MKILLTNDDGYDAFGIKVLFEYFSQRNHEVFIIAPDSQRSCCSHQISIYDSVEQYNISDNVVALKATPADCVMFGLKGICPFEPDVVISGVNSGSNIGRDILYSGTVAAARQGAIWNVPSIALSYDRWQSDIFEQNVVAFLEKYFVRLVDLAQNTDYFVNVNIPHKQNLSVDDVVATTLSRKMTYDDKVASFDAPNGIRYLWMKGKIDNSCLEEGSDAFELNINHRISVSLVETYPTSIKFEL